MKIVMKASGNEKVNICSIKDKAACDLHKPTQIVDMVKCEQNTYLRQMQLNESDANFDKACTIMVWSAIGMTQFEMMECSASPTCGCNHAPS